MMRLAVDEVLPWYLGHTYLSCYGLRTLLRQRGSPLSLGRDEEDAANTAHRQQDLPLMFHLGGNATPRKRQLAPPNRQQR